MAFAERLGNFIWNPWLLGLFLLSGLYFSVRTGFFQLFHVRLWLAFYIAVNECISITENLSACGVRLPGFLAAALGNARDKLDQH